MSAIPLHIQRRIEQRWAARLIPQAELISPKSAGLKRAAPASRRIRKPKEKPADMPGGLSPLDRKSVV